MNNENELPARMQWQDCHGAKQAIKFAWPKRKILQVTGTVYSSQPQIIVFLKFTIVKS